MTTTERSERDNTAGLQDEQFPSHFPDRVLLHDFDENSIDSVQGTALPSDSRSDLPIHHLILHGIEIDENGYVGKGAFGSVYQAVYGGIACALKQQNFGLKFQRNPVSCEVFCVYTIQDFQRECLLHSKLRHPNIVKMYGVCYYSERPNQPIKVMELVEGGTLSSLLTTYHTIPMYVKLSILQDVSRGLHYLHTHNPPIIHCHINTDVIMLTSTLTAKIGSFTFAQEVVPKVEKVSDSNSANQTPVYPCQSFLSVSHGFPFDVYLFGYVVCRVMTQVRYGNLYQYMTDDDTGKLFVTCDFTFVQQYVDHMSRGPLKQLTISCLGHDPVERPSISQICERIDTILMGEF